MYIKISLASPYISYLHLDGHYFVVVSADMQLPDLSMLTLVDK